MPPCLTLSKGKVEQSREWSIAPLHFSVVAIEKGAFELPSTLLILTHSLNGVIKLVVA